MVVIRNKEEMNNIDEQTCEYLFLSFLEEDIEKHPENIEPLTQSMQLKANELLDELGDIDLEKPL